MQDMLEKVKGTISKYRLLSGGERLVVGFSGGVDSLCLLHILKNLTEYNLEIWALYINHSLRPAENLEEERLLYELGEKWGILVKKYTVNIPEKLKEKPQSIQLLAREERYKIFVKFREEIKAHKVALAHHRDDQAETVLYRIIRGTGLEGLAGMPIIRDGIFIRPLLEVARSEILEYAALNNLSWVEDSSNRKLIYQRNKLRLQLIPEIEKSFNPRFKEALLRLSRLAEEQKDFMEQVMAELSGKILVAENGRTGIQLKPFLDLHTYLRYCFLKEVISQLKPNYQIEQVSLQNLLEKISEENYCFKPTQIHKGIIVYLEREILFFENSLNWRRKFDFKVFPVAMPGITVLSEINLQIKIETGLLPESWSEVSANEVYVNAEEIKLPLAIRFWKPGDFFKPLGITGTQKLQDFFIDHKIPRRLRNIAPLLVNADGRIIWIVGYRLSDEFKITRAHKFLTAHWHITTSAYKNDTITDGGSR